MTFKKREATELTASLFILYFRGMTYLQNPAHLVVIFHFINSHIFVLRVCKLLCSAVCSLVVRNLLAPKNGHKGEDRTTASRGHPQSPWEPVLFYVSLACPWSETSMNQLITALCQHVFNSDQPYTQ